MDINHIEIWEMIYYWLQDQAHTIDFQNNINNQTLKYIQIYIKYIKEYTRM